jgi:hypothetical protein
MAAGSGSAYAHPQKVVRCRLVEQKAAIFMRLRIDGRKKGAPGLPPFKSQPAKTHESAST